MFGGETSADLQVGEDVRIDDEQTIKYEEILEMLLAGGYFRARIKGLTPFDKVVGGLAWSITASGEAVDIELLYSDNLAIGQRVALAENIIKALLLMKCPHRLQPQQIQRTFVLTRQGLDYKSIFPVVQWMIKKVIEYRLETGDLLRRYSEAQFGKEHRAPADRAFEARRPAATEAAHGLKQTYRPQRQYRRRANERANVQATLLEYGQQTKYSSRPEAKAQSSQAAAIEKTLGEGESEAEREQRRVEAELRKLERLERADTPRGFASLINNAEVDAATAEYGAELVAEEQKGPGGAKLHAHKVAVLGHQVEARKREFGELKEAHAERRAAAAQAQAAVAELEAKVARLQEEIAKLDALETPENAAKLKVLKELIALNESLKAHEALFRANCKAQMQELKERVARLREAGPDDDSERRALIEQTHSKDRAKLEKIRQLAAKKGRDINLVERKIDEVPSRAELAQYQRMFLELYEQVATRLAETRQYYITYNTLEDSRAFLAKEVSILNSIRDNYSAAMKSKANKEPFLASLKQIVEGVLANLRQAEEKRGKEKESLDQLAEQYLRLVQKERQYYNATKDFQDEARKNELLLAKLNQ